MATLLRAGIRRSRWRSAAGALVSLIAAGTLFSALMLFSGMQTALDASLSKLRAELLLTQRGGAAAAAQLLTTGSAPPLEPTIPVADWERRMREGGVVGVVAVEGLDLSEGGAGAPAAERASVLLVHLEQWATPAFAVAEIELLIPEAEVVVAEQTVRQVARQLEPILRYLFIGAGVAMLATVLLTGLITSVRVAERRTVLGMMRAMGASQSFLLRLTLAESGLLSIGGALLGVVAGLLLMLLLAGDTLTHVPQGEWLRYGIGSLVATVAMALLATLGPAILAARMDPLEAARRGR